MHYCTIKSNCSILWTLKVIIILPYCTQNSQNSRVKVPQFLEFLSTIIKVMSHSIFLCFCTSFLQACSNFGMKFSLWSRGCKFHRSSSSIPLRNPVITSLKTTETFKKNKNSPKGGNNSYPHEFVFHFIGSFS